MNRHEAAIERVYPGATILRLWSSHPGVTEASLVIDGRVHHVSVPTIAGPDNGTYHVDEVESGTAPLTSAPNRRARKIAAARKRRIK